MIVQVVLHCEMDALLQSGELEILEVLAQGLIRECLPELAIRFRGVELDVLDPKLAAYALCQLSDGVLEFRYQ